MEIALILGIVGMSGIWMYFAFQLNDEHFILKLLSIFFSIISLFYIAPVFTNGVEATARSLLKLPYSFFTIFSIYFIGFIFYHWFGKPKALSWIYQIKK